jgi:hypothetical protein
MQRRESYVCRQGQGQALENPAAVKRQPPRAKGAGVAFALELRLDRIIRIEYLIPLIESSLNRSGVHTVQLDRLGLGMTISCASFGPTNPLWTFQQRGVYVLDHGTVTEVAVAPHRQDDQQSHCREGCILAREAAAARLGTSTHPSTFLVLDQSTWGNVLLSTGHTR